MATSADTLAFLLDQLNGLPGISQRKMFGEYCIYLDGKPIALLCDDQLFVKPTEAGRQLASPIVEAPPYPGAKLHWLIGADRWEDREPLQALLRVTAAALPLPQPRRKRKTTAP